MVVFSGGVADATKVDSGGYLNVSGIASGTTVNSGGAEYLYSGAAYATIVSSGGAAYVYSGIASGTTVVGGGSIAVYGGSADATTLDSGAVLDVLGGSASSTLIGSGATVVVGSDAEAGVIAEGTVTNTTVASGGVLVLMPGGSASSSHVASGGVVVSTGEVEVSAGHDLVTTTASGLAIGVNDEFYVLPGGTASAISVASGGFAAISGGIISSYLIGSGGSAIVGSGGRASAGIVSGGTLSVNSGGTLTSVTAEASGYLYLNSGVTVDGATVDNGGTVYVAPGATVEGTDVTSGGVLNLFPGEPSFELASGTAGATTLAAGGAIDLEYLTYVSGATASVNGSDLLTVIAGAGSATLQLAGNYNGESFAVTAGVASDLSFEAGTLVTAVPCYCRGTRILTDRGEVAVEELCIGDRLITRAGTAKPLRWIGRRAYSGRFTAANRELLPIRIRPGALSEGVPKRDLHVSPLHALLVGGVLIPARALVNGGSIVRLQAVETLEYFHLELDCHDIILAEGAPAETYLDDRNRFMFQNAVEYGELYPDQALVPPQYCARRIGTGVLVAAIRARLAKRGKDCGYFPPDSLAIPLAVGVTNVVVPSGVGRLHLLSRFGKNGADQRWLGALLTGLAIDGVKLDLTDARLTEGFNGIEHHGGRKVRWTTGDAVVTFDPEPIEQSCQIEIGAMIGVDFDTELCRVK